MPLDRLASVHGHYFGSGFEKTVGRGARDRAFTHIRVVVKIMVPFWVRSMMRHLVFRGLKRGFPKFLGRFWRVPITRIKIFRSPYWGPLIFGSSYRELEPTQGTTRDYGGPIRNSWGPLGLVRVVFKSHPFATNRVDIGL